MAYQFHSIDECVCPNHYLEPLNMHVYLHNTQAYDYQTYNTRTLTAATCQIFFLFVSRSHSECMTLINILPIGPH